MSSADENACKEVVLWTHCRFTERICGIIRALVLENFFDQPDVKVKVSRKSSIKFETGSPLRNPGAKKASEEGAMMRQTALSRSGSGTKHYDGHVYIIYLGIFSQWSGPLWLTVGQHPHLPSEGSVSLHISLRAPSYNLRSTISKTIILFLL